MTEILQLKNRKTRCFSNIQVVEDDRRLLIRSKFLRLIGAKKHCHVYAIVSSNEIAISRIPTEDAIPYIVDQYLNVNVTVDEYVPNTEFKITIDNLQNAIVCTNTKKVRKYSNEIIQGTKPYLKWAGGKYKVVPKLRKFFDEIPTTKIRLVEPFVGAASVFLNTDFDEYLLSDGNQHLINIHCHIKELGQEFIEMARPYFAPENNTADVYYQLRDRFNSSTNFLEQSCLFLYLNRHCYNGLCRYNSRGGFNVPFGRYSTIYFPEQEMLAFHIKAQKAQFVVSDFKPIMEMLKPGDIVYCDPPYVPLTTNFTYTGEQFGLDAQQKIVDYALAARENGIPVFISNHDCVVTRDLYQDATKIVCFEVRRNISSRERGEAKELLAIYK